MLAPSTVDRATGNLLLDGTPVFPIGLSDGPPSDGLAPDTGLNAWAEIAAAGVNFVRNYTVWSPAGTDEQMLVVGQELDAASTHKLQVWLALAGVDNDLSKRTLLDRIVNEFKAHPGLGVWKGADEPAHARIPAAGCVAVYDHLRSLDPHHAVAIIEAPRGPAATPGGRDTPLTVEAIEPYASACDIHGVDIYPIPPGAHAGGPPVNRDLSVVGDMTRLVGQASRSKGIWTTLQIAWSGVIPPHPILFPSLQQARFMAYDAIVSGARGLFFFGGQIKQVLDPADRKSGWNWTYWRNVQRPLVIELTDHEHAPALTAALSSTRVRADTADIALSAREANGFLYVIAVRKNPTRTGTVRFDGLPRAISQGLVLGHGSENPARAIPVADGSFTDPSAFGPHNARVYRFRLPG